MRRAAARRRCRGLKEGGEEIADGLGVRRRLGGWSHMQCGRMKVWKGGGRDERHAHISAKKWVRGRGGAGRHNTSKGAASWLPLRTCLTQKCATCRASDGRQAWKNGTFVVGKGKGGEDSAC